MDTSTLLTVPPTFPVDPRRIRIRRLGRVAKSPVTLVTCGAATVIGALADLGITGVLLIASAALAGLVKYWTTRRPELDEACLRELIDENHLAQNLALQDIARRLSSTGHPAYAQYLRRFLGLKRQVEEQVQQGRFALFAQEVEESVDGISKEVCLEITRLCGQEQELAGILTSGEPERLDRYDSWRQESQKALLQAYASLSQIFSSILAFHATSQPGDPMAAAPGQRLNEILGRLRDEAEIISRTGARLRSSISS